MEAEQEKLVSRRPQLIEHMANRIEELAMTMDKLYELLEQRKNVEPEALTVEQAAQRLGRRPFTVRQWCRLGRIVAHRATSRGPYAEWRISPEAIRQVQTYGLLPCSSSKPL